MSRTAFLLRLGLLGLLAAVMLACAFGPEGASQSTAGSNAVFSCATATPLPTVSPIPIVCTDSTPGPDGTPGPQECSKPEPTATPRPTATPYGRWLSPGDRGSSDTFYQDQDVRIGGLKLTLTGYRTAPLTGRRPAWPTSGPLRCSNEGRSDLDVQWPLQMLVREVVRPDGTTTAGDWWETPASEAAAGIPAWNPDHGTLAPNEAAHRDRGDASPGGPRPRRRLLSRPGERRPARRAGECRPPALVRARRRSVLRGRQHERPAPPGRRGRGLSQAAAAHGQRPLWRDRRLAAGHRGIVDRDAGLRLHRFPRVDPASIVPNSKPWYHTGIDIAAAYGTPLLSVVSGRVLFIGPSSGSRECLFPGAQPPRFNLGWETIIQLLDSAGRPTGVVNKIGHQIVNSQRVQVGDLVQIGQILGLMGSPPAASTGTHVHVMFQRGTTCS